MVAANDFRLRRIKNKHMLAALGVQALWLGATSLHVVPPLFLITSWSQSVIGLFVGLLLFFPLWRFGAMGAGDIKLIATLGFILGLAGLFPVLLLATAVCGGHALVTVAGVGGWQTARTQWQQGAGMRRGLPYGAYLALAALMWVLWRVMETHG